MAVEVPLLKVPDHVLAACQQGGGRSRSGAQVRSAGPIRYASSPSTRPEENIRSSARLCPTNRVSILKRQLWDALFVDLATSMKDADEEMRESLKSADFKKGVAHFLEKRPARFSGN